MAHDVFISYSSKDKTTADAVCNALEERGIRCWIAPRDVKAGESYARALVNGIHESRLMVLIFSSDSNRSPQVLREVERAVSKGLPILPLRIQDVELSDEMEYYIASRHWLDALTPPLEQHLARLGDDVAYLISRSSVEPPRRSLRQSRRLLPFLRKSARRSNSRRRSQSRSNKRPGRNHRR